MVYRGRPSTGCLKCRKRKIKCDERPNGCLKCAEKGYMCPGYENTIDRLFQDESAHVEQKSKTAKAKALALRDKEDARGKTQRKLVKFRESIDAPLLGPLIDQGISFFMSNYALGLDEPPIQSESYHKHLSTHGFHPIVSTSMTALGLAGISNIFMDPSLKTEATRWYLKALRMTNTALASPTEVKCDHTLLATMLLSMFEATNNERSLAGWSKHVEGSASLLRMRGRDQFSTPTGRWMYQSTVGLLTMNCIGRGVSIPKFVREMNNESRKHQDPRHPGNKFYNLHLDVTDFRADVLHGRLIALPDIIDRALELDKLAAVVFKDVDATWQYEEIPTQYGVPGVYGSHYHIYPHVASAQTWNWVRTNRIYLLDIIRNSIILGYSLSPPSLVGERYDRLLQESTRKLHTMQADILASVPQHLHDTPMSPMLYMRETQDPHRQMISTASPGQQKYFWSNFQESKSPQDTFATPAVSEERLPKIRISGGYSSLWALFVAGSTAIATPESQRFVLRSLYRIEQEFGFSQAKVLANALNLKILLDQTGSQPFEIVPSYLPADGEHYHQEYVVDVGSKSEAEAADVDEKS